MTKKVAVERLMSVFDAGPTWRGFFEKKVDELNGEENIVSETTYDNILSYIRNLT